MSIPLSEILNHLGEERSDYLNSVAPPLFQSSNFTFSSVHEMREALKKELETPFYTRGYNPTIGTLRKKVAALESAEEALIFSSGSAAVAAAVLSVVSSGDHVVCVDKPYSWTRHLLEVYLKKFNVEVTFVDGTEASNYQNASKENTVLYYMESPNSITFELQDIQAVCEMARSRGISTIIDNSYSTPIYQKPIEMGADLVVHSGSKYFGGHSDLVAGILCGSKERLDKINAEELMTLGAIISPFDAWLMLRSIRTLPLRVEKAGHNGMKVAAFLGDHPKVGEIYYPFHPSHPQFELAKSQMSGPGGLISFKLATEDLKQIERFCDSLKLFLLACSWGGHESLIFPQAALMDSRNYDKGGVTPNMVRIYTGLEDADDLIQDLKYALDQID